MDKYNNYFLEQLFKKFRDKYTVSSWEGYKNRRSTIKFKCFKHGEYKSIATNVLTSPVGNCKECSVDKRFEEFCTKAYDVHGNDYTYHRDFYKDSRTCMDIFCNIHNKNFKQRPSAHLQGQGCPLCKNSKSSNTKISVAVEEFVIKARAKYGDKFKYHLNTYRGMKSIMKITCPEHGSFDCLPREHLNSNFGCIACNKENRRLNLKEDLIRKVNDYYPNKDFDYSKVIYIKNTVPVTILCKEHNEAFDISPNKLLDRTRSEPGCTYCKDLPLNRWTLKGLTNYKNIYNLRGYFYIGYISCLDHFKLGVTKDLVNRKGFYKRDLKKYEDVNFSYYKTFEVGYYKAFVVEAVLKKVLKNERVKHRLDFGGKTEVFDLKSNHFILIENLLSGDFSENINIISNSLLTEEGKEFIEICEILYKEV